MSFTSQEITTRANVEFSVFCEGRGSDEMRIFPPLQEAVEIGTSARKKGKWFIFKAPETHSLGAAG